MITHAVESSVFPIVVKFGKIKTTELAVFQAVGQLSLQR